MRLPPIVKALSLQLVAVLVIGLLIRIAGVGMPLWLATIAAGCVAAVLSRLAGLPRWWLPTQACFVPAVAAMLWLDLHSWVYLLIFLMLATVYWSTYRSQVPLYLSSRQIWMALEKLLPQGRPFTFIDIGAGLGGVLDHLSRERADGEFVGVENAPLPYILAKWRLRICKNCNMQRGDFWQMKLGAYDVVYAYLSPVPMARLWEKAVREMRPGSLLISNTFEIPGQAPDMIVETQDFHRSRLLVWRIK